MPLSSVCMYVVNIFNIFSSETTGPIKVKFRMKHLWDGATKICSTGPCLMTKMADKKSSKIFFSGTRRSITLKLNLHHWVLRYYQVCSNDKTVLTLTYFMARSNLVPYAFVWAKGKTMDFSKSFVVYDIEVGRCS